MASEDVIELGSSDDEAAPAPKKVKPAPNTMVHIPHRIPGLVIKPSKSAPNLQHLAGKPLTVTKIPYIHKNKANGKTLQNTNTKPIIRQNTRIQNTNPKPIIRRDLQHSRTINPMSLMKKLANTQIKVNRIPSKIMSVKPPIRVQNPKSLNNLPPSITVTKTSACLKRPANTYTPNVRKIQKMNPKTVIGEVLTVELDDDEGFQGSTASPQWYLRPEQQEEMQVEGADLEKKNNEEPEPSKFIEITIEDSPVKPVHSKRTCQIANELSITIEDSPIKDSAENAAKEVDSDNESPKNIKEFQSKKKLEYPKESTLETGKTIEIEIESMAIEFEGPVTSSKTNKEDVTIVHEVVEKPDSLIKKSVPQQSSMRKEDEKDSETVVTTGERESDFHPVYQNFIDLCLKLENSDDMKKIVEKKIKAYYKQVPTEYTESEQFIDMVSSKILSMKAGPEKMYLYIKDVVDELNLQRKMAKSQVVNKETKNTEPDKFLYGEESEFDSKRQRQIRKLEKTLKKLHRAIQKLEDQEVDFDDEEDSVYLLTERYKERMVRVHAKFCQLTNSKMPSEPKVQIDARPGKPSGPAKRIEKWINKRVPIGTPLPFPDFHDVLRCVREANEEDNLGWNEADIMEEARDLFTRCGKKLQRRRQENEWRVAASRISVDIDPAEGDEGLKKKLEENKKLATKKETEVFNKYADRQSQLKLEAEEIEDKEAEESPVESEEDEVIEESSALENKEKRKERLRRLIQEKSKKNNGKLDGSKEPQDNKNIENSEETINKEVDENSVSSEKDEAKNNVAMANDLNKNSQKIEEIELNSDESNKLESDVDELHLLQKLHSGNEIDTSTLDSSETDTSVNAFSDTLHSSSDNKVNQASDVISIENSSYSESEATEKTHSSKDASDSKTSKIDSDDISQSNKTIRDAGVEIDSVPFQAECKKSIQTNNDEYTESVGNILLASSDEEVWENKADSQCNDDACLNLKDDDIFIGDTIVQDVDNQQHNNMKEKSESNINNTNSEVSAVVNEEFNTPSIEKTQDQNSIVSNTINNVELTENENDVPEFTLKDLKESRNLEVKANTDIDCLENNSCEPDVVLVDDPKSVEDKDHSEKLESITFEQNKLIKLPTVIADNLISKVSGDINNPKLTDVDCPATKELSSEKVEHNMEVKSVNSTCDALLEKDEREEINKDKKTDSLDNLLEEFRSDLESIDNFSSTSAMNKVA